MLNADRIKYDKDLNIEEVFSPRYGYDFVPEKILNEIRKCHYSWDFYGKYVHLSDNSELEEGYRNNFFIMKPDGEWIFRLKNDNSYLSEDDGFVKPFVESAKFQRYELIPGYKLYKGDEEIWVNEEKFYSRLKSRTPITRKELFRKFVIKYETIFNWLCVKFDGREKFWKTLENDYNDNVFDKCFEIRLEEIVCQCTSSTRKYWRTQKSMSARKKRMALFKSDILKQEDPKVAGIIWEKATLNTKC
jgi:hypothetical protein